MPERAEESNEPQAKLPLLTLKFGEALAKHDDDMTHFVEAAESQGRVFVERLKRWTEQVANTLQRFGLHDAARDIKLVRGQHDDVMGHEYLSSRPGALRVFLVETFEHVVAGRYVLTDPDAPATPEPRIKPREPYEPDRRVVSMAPPPGSRLVPPPTEPPSTVHVHGDFVQGDKNTNSGSGGIVSGNKNSVSFGRPGAANTEEGTRTGEQPPLPTSVLAAVGEIIAPRHGPLWRRKLFVYGVVTLGIVGLAITGFLALAPQETKTKTLDRISAWFK